METGSAVYEMVTPHCAHSVPETGLNSLKEDTFNKTLRANQRRTPVQILNQTNYL